MNDERPGTKDLVRRALGGDQDAYTELYAMLLPRMKSVAYFTLRNNEEQADGAHDMIAHIFKNLPKFRFECKFTTWAHQVANNYALMRLRKAKSTLRSGPEQTLSLDYEINGETVMQVADTRNDHNRVESEELVATILNRLPAGYRRVLESRFLMEMTFAEIGKKYDRQTGTMKSQQNKALRMAREVLAEMEAR